jgi:hypothetical protein
MIVAHHSTLGDQGSYLGLRVEVIGYSSEQCRHLGARGAVGVSAPAQTISDAVQDFNEVFNNHPEVIWVPTGPDCHGRGRVQKFHRQGLGPTASFSNAEFQPGTALKRGDPIRHGGSRQEDIAALIGLDKTKSFGCVEPLDFASRHRESQPRRK